MRFAWLLLTLPVLAQQGGDSGRGEKERALGRHLAGEIRRQSSPLADSAVTAYVDRIGRAISPASDFEVISGGLWTEPFAVSGGHVFVPARALLAARDDSEFVGLLAHAVAHLALGHGKPAPSRGELVNVANVPLVYMGSWSGAHVEASVSELLLPMSLLDAQKKRELEADRLGLELASRAGYDPAAFRRYIERTQIADRRISALPARDVRLAAIEQTLATLASASRNTAAEEFQEMQRRVRAQIATPEPRTKPTLRR